MRNKGGHTPGRITTESQMVLLHRLLLRAVIALSLIALIATLRYVKRPLALRYSSASRYHLAISIRWQTISLLGALHLASNSKQLAWQTVMDDTIINSEDSVTARRRELLSRFAEALVSAWEQALSAFCSWGLQGEPAMFFQKYLTQRTRAWLKWISSHWEEDDFDIDKFKSFAPGLLFSFKLVHKARFRSKDKTPLDRSLFDWLLKELSSASKHRDRADQVAYRRMLWAVSEMHEYYALIILPDELRHTGRARSDSIVSLTFSCNDEGKVNTTGKGISEGSASDADRCDSAFSLSPTTL